MADFYVALTYDAYKEFETQCKEFRETIHVSTDERFYHKAFRFRLGGTTFEVLGPDVPQPRRD